MHPTRTFIRRRSDVAKGTVQFLFLKISQDVRESLSTL
jgi:hypothetical protein